MPKGKGWDYFNSDDANEKFNSEDESTGWGYKNAYSSDSYYGDDGSNSIDDAEQEDEDDEEDEDNDSSNGVSFEEALGNAVGLVLGVAMTAVIAKEKEKEAQEEAERKERRARRKVWRRQHRKGMLTLYLICFLAILGLVGYCELSIRIPVGYDKHDLVGNDYQSVIRQLERAGFRYVSEKAVEDLSVDEIQDDSLVFDVKIGWSNSFNEESKYPANFPVKVIYHSLETLDVPISSKEANKSDYETVLKKFQNAGFTNIKTETRYDIITGWISNDGDIKSVTINGDKKFYESSTYRADVEVVITYHTLKKNKPK